MLELKGIVKEIIYRNAENGYTVLEIATEDGNHTAVGLVPPVNDGEMLILKGEYVYNKKFGEQFNISSIKISPPSAQENIAKYLSSGLFKGIGKVTAEAIVNAFSDKTLEVIEFSPHKLATLKGISIKKAEDISEIYKSNIKMQEAIIYLQQFNVSVNLAIKIYKKYNEGIYFILNTNPYKMVEDIDGIGFITADKIAIAMNVDCNSSFRIKAGISYILKDNASSNGHTYLPEKELYKETIKLLNYGEDMLEIVGGIVNEMSLFGEIKIINKSNHNAIMLTKIFKIEKSIAENLIKIIHNAKIEHNINLVEKILTNYQIEHNISLHEMQKKAIIDALTSGAIVITGGPGTGKTTIIKAIIAMLDSSHISYALCAPTGRAAKRMGDATCVDAMTIHRMLDLNYKSDSYSAAFTYDENNKLDADVIIIDEVSMCDEYVFNALIKAIKNGGRIIMVGDADQLPSVGAGNVLEDIISSGVIPVVKLTYVYRQDEDSLIIENAHRINNGTMPVFDNSKKDFFYINKSDAEDIVNEICELCTKRLPEFNGVDPLSIQVLCPMKKGISGVNNLNIALQKKLNPSHIGKSELALGANTYRVGDKVMHIKNNYKLEWSRIYKHKGKLINENGIGVYNGDIGIISSVDKNNMSLTVSYEDGRLAEYTGDILDQLQLAYAISIHKSQGSEFDVVVLSLMSGSYLILNRNLLYTAITRAKNMVVIVGDKQVIEKMVANNFIKKRYTLLTELLTDKNNIYTSDGV